MGVWLLLGVLAMLFQYRYSRPVTPGIHKKLFQREVVRQQGLLDSATHQLALAIDRGSNIWVAMDSARVSPFLYLVYRDTIAVGWSSQRVSVEGKSFADFEAPVIHLPNGWYMTSRYHSGQVGVVGLMLLKSDYPYQNQYLVNEFNDCFGRIGKYDLSIEPVEGGIEISNGKGDYLFSLVNEQGSTPLRWAGWFSLLALVGWLVLSGFLIVMLMETPRVIPLRNRLWGAVVLGGVAIYYALFVAEWYTSVGVLEIFSPVWFASSTWLASVGAFFMATVFITFFIWLFCRYYRQPQQLAQYPALMTVLGWSMLTGCLLIINYLLHILVEHSSETFLFMHISDFNVVSVVKMCIVFLLLFSLGLLVHRFIPLLLRDVSVKIFWIILLGVSLFLWTLGFWFSRLSGWDTSLFFGFLVLYIKWMHQRAMALFSFRYVVWLLLIADVYAVGRIHMANLQKEKDNRNFLIEMLAGNMTGEQDPVAEMYLSDMENKIAYDEDLREMISGGDIFDEELRDYLLKNYFFGYLSRYDIQVVPCWPKAELYVEGTDETYDCYRYFDEMLLRYGEPVSGSNHFHLMKKDNGQVNYFGVFQFFKDEPGLELSVFLEFTSKPFFEGPGYPELLLSDKDRTRLELLQGYSYAGYVNGKLVKRSGDYLYEVSRSKTIDPVGDKVWTKKGDYSHLSYAYRSGAVVVMSYPLQRLSNLLIAFSLFFVVFLGVSFVLMIVSRLATARPAERYSIQQRIQISMIAFMVFLLVVIGVSTVLYSSWQFKKKNSEMLSQRLKSVMLEMEQKVGSEGALTPEMADYLNYLLQNFSNVFYSDINLYGLDGHLLGTSRPELYQRGVIGNLMNPTAYRSLAFMGQREFIHQESIGDLEFTSAYVPFLNQRNEVLAYLNLPYFVGTNELRNEISSILVAIINAYLIFVLVAIGMAVFAAQQITRPLQLIRQRLSQMRLGSKNEKITYSGADEISHLVDTYNRMVDELTLSADKLARSEREMAWREMAKQVAHEIKNPLTPMQLSVQYLQKAWRDQVPDFDSYIQRVTQTLIEQIQQLSVIANEFSHFAKMPAAKRQPITVIDKLRNTVSLYEKSSDVQFQVNCLCSSDLQVFMDGEQLLSVFNNLIKNGVQAIPDKQQGNIDIAVSQHGQWIEMAFRDNGKGIPDEVRAKMFTPNFTTKTSGMGLGLAIVKNIVESSGGTIRFESEAGKGTVFYVRLPLFDEVS